LSFFLKTSAQGKAPKPHSFNRDDCGEKLIAAAMPFYHFTLLITQQRIRIKPAHPCSDAPVAFGWE
jgi:hypothetical protein